MRPPISRSAEIANDRRPIIIVDDADAIDPITGIVRDGHSIRVPMLAITGTRSRPTPAGSRRRIFDAIDADDDDQVVKDGQSVRVPMTLADTAFRRALYDQCPPRAVCGELVDALGDHFWIGHRPGYVFAAPTSEVQHLRDQTERERSKLTRQRAEAWRGPVPTFIAAPAVPQSGVERSNVSAGYVRRAPSPSAPTAAPVSLRSETTDAERAREARHARDKDAWR